MMGVTYRGRHSREFGLVVRTNPSILPGFTNNIVKVPGSHGVLPVSTEYDAKIIPLEIGFAANNILDYSDRLRILGDWLKPTDGIGEYIADHEPDKVYYAMLDDSEISRVEHIARMGKGTLRLTCPDPFAYGEERTYELNNDMAVANEGTIDSYPVFDLTITQETDLIFLSNDSSLDVTGASRSIYIGTESSPDNEPTADKTLVLHDTMQSTNGWVGVNSIDSGIVTGTMAADDEGFYAIDYGPEDTNLRSSLQSIDTDINNRRTNFTIQVDNKQRELNTLKKKLKPTETDKTKMKNLQTEINGLNEQRQALDAERNTRRAIAQQGANYWVGPSLKRDLPRELNSFIAEIELSNRNFRDLDGRTSLSGIGINEIYFRDINDNMVFKIQFGDTWSNAAINHYVFAMNQFRKTYQSPNPADLNDFRGLVRVTRDSGYFYLTLVVRHSGRVAVVDLGRVIPDVPIANNNSIKSIQVAARKYIGSTRIFQRINQIKIWDLVGEFDAPVKNSVHRFRAGDRISIDSRRGIMTLNDEPRTDLFHLGTDFFTLVEGLNRISTSDNFTGTVTFRNRYV